MKYFWVFEPEDLVNNVVNVCKFNAGLIELRVRKEPPLDLGEDGPGGGQLIGGGPQQARAAEEVAEDLLPVRVLHGRGLQEGLHTEF